jgi:hypothetical protein
MLQHPLRADDAFASASIVHLLGLSAVDRERALPSVVLLDLTRKRLIV